MRFSNEPRSLRAFRVETRSLDSDDENKDDLMSSDSEIRDDLSKLLPQNLAATSSRLELSPTSIFPTGDSQYPTFKISWLW